jgi:hypothetical protein
MIQDGCGEGLCRGHPRFHAGIGEYVSRSFPCRFSRSSTMSVLRLTNHSLTILESPIVLILSNVGFIYLEISKHLQSKRLALSVD